jgi:hypothetical protein
VQDAYQPKTAVSGPGSIQMRFIKAPKVSIPPADRPAWSERRVSRRRPRSCRRSGHRPRAWPAERHRTPCPARVRLRGVSWGQRASAAASSWRRRISATIAARPGLPKKTEAPAESCFVPAATTVTVLVAPELPATRCALIPKKNSRARWGAARRGAARWRGASKRAAIRQRINRRGRRASRSACRPRGSTWIGCAP